MTQLYQVLLELQELDQEIHRAEAEAVAFEPRLAEVEQPATALSAEIDSLRERLATMRQDVRRLEQAAEQKRGRLRRYQEHLERARNVREEAAARAEIDLVSGAVEADEHEALTLMEQVTRTELKLAELERQLEKVREEVAPRRAELTEQKAAAEEKLAILRDRRENHAIRLDPRSRGLYERVRGGRTRTVLAALTPDGACGHCFNVLPVQEQAQVRRGTALQRCEACGVILYPATD